jgi:DNA-binding NarL/FixJ family response regulator
VVRGEEADGRKLLRLMLVEDHAAFRHAMATLLGREADLEVVAEASSLGEARHHLTSVGFDVAILDLGLPDGHGADLIAEVREARPGAAVLILSSSLDPDNLARAKEAGADGVLDKFATPDQVIGTIRRMGTRMGTG